MNTRNRATAYVLGTALASTLNGLACRFDTSRIKGGSGIFVEPNPVCDHELR